VITSKTTAADSLPLTLDEFFVDAVLLVGCAVLAPRLLASALYLRARVSLHAADIGHWMA
jgi:hypothetical protein